MRKIISVTAGFGKNASIGSAVDNIQKQLSSYKVKRFVGDIQSEIELEISRNGGSYIIYEGILVQCFEVAEESESGMKIGFVYSRYNSRITLSAARKDIDKQLDEIKAEPVGTVIQLHEGFEIDKNVRIYSGILVQPFVVSLDSMFK